MALPASAIRGLKVMRVIGPLLYNRPVKRFLQSLLKSAPPVPSAEGRANGFSIMLGEASDGARTVRSKQNCPEGYHLTMLTATEIAKRILAGNLKPGFQTPSLAYGADFILEFPGSSREDLD